jgi:integrase
MLRAMSGHITRRPDGRWLVVFESGTDPASGKRRRHTQLLERQREARETLHRLEEESRQGIFAHPSRITVAEFLRAWFDLRARHRLRPTTAQRYRGIIEDKLVPALGACRLAELTPLQVQAACAAWQDAGLSPTTVSHQHAVLRTALRWAADTGQIARNPAVAASPPPRRQREMIALEADQCRVLLEALARSVLYTPVLIALGTGLRRGEVCGLQWKDVDLAKGTLRVVRTLTQTSDGLFFAEPKTAASRRSITLPSALTSELRAIRKLQAQNRLVLAGAYQDNGLVYCDPDGSAHRPESLSGTFANWMRRNHERLGMPRIGFHGLRHTHATILAAAGVSPKAIAARLGHTNAAFTMQVYSHVLRDMDSAATEAVSRVLL